LSQSFHLEIARRPMTLKNKMRAPVFRKRASRY
jgi:hypothetical protein